MSHSDDPEAIRPRKTRGRPFAAGNSGRKRGSKNRTTLVAESLLEGETEELMRHSRRSPAPADMPSSPLSELPARMISMHPTCR